MLLDEGGECAHRAENLMVAVRVRALRGTVIEKSDHADPRIRVHLQPARQLDALFVQAGYDGPALALQLEQLRRRGTQHEMCACLANERPPPPGNEQRRFEVAQV